MFPVIRLENEALDLQSRTVIKSHEYRQFVDAREVEKKIIKQARQEYQKEKKRGFEEGLLSAKDKEVELLLANAAKIIRSYQEVEQNLVEVVISSIRKILNEFSKEELAYQVVRKALYHLSDGAQVTVKIPTEIAEPVREKIVKSLEFYPGLDKFEVVADPALNDGDCRIESNFGVITAGLNEQINALTKALRKQLAGSAQPEQQVSQTS